MNKPIVPNVIRRIYEGRVFTVTVESITLPRGHRLDCEIVRHPGSVVLVPVTPDGDIVLVRQYRHAVGTMLWELPAGSLKPGEIPEEAAARECHEETGMVPSRLERLGSFYPTPGYCDEEMVFYSATGLRTPGEADRAVQPDEDEDIEVKAFPTGVVRAMIRSGEIVDLKSVAGLALYRDPARDQAIERAAGSEGRPYGRPA
jgi:ADP-ribose pyrophosphatase